MSRTTFLSNSDAKTAPHSSRRGNDTDFNGATLVLEVNVLISKGHTLKKKESNWAFQNIPNVLELLDSMKVKSFASTKCPGGKSFRIDLSFEVHFLSSNPADDKALTN
ncbi:hypothetical protein FF38_04823 [Lucilia cuprina]|uniref:Uncharacterized protein n=1 Tax=Lucilia cuprina TaxID=7375 RepID=A0A0L0C0N0_LUCCU|nr:hypothetical protein FF38_04823 [Lucilia cuprina]